MCSGSPATVRFDDFLAGLPEIERAIMLWFIMVCYIDRIHIEISKQNRRIDYSVEKTEENL